jgi:tRNA threonylcarbamoyl adenosine modification protein YeaZ
MKKKSPVILAVDATGDVMTVALESGGRTFVARRSGKLPHDETLLPAVASVLKRARASWEDLDAVAAAAGPGRFTGIRIGLAFAAMAAMKLGIPVLALSRLEAAAETSGADDVLAALPGWKNEVYHQRFRRKKSGPAADGVAEWTAPDAWPHRREAAESRGVTVVYADAGAAELLPVARRRLASGRIPPFEPFYLKPAGYEKPRR